VYSRNVISSWFVTLEEGLLFVKPFFVPTNNHLTPLIRICQFSEFWALAAAR
jgi:hypothetical protein